MAHRDFDVPVRQAGDEITFTVAGRKFRALPTPPIGAVIRMGHPTSVIADLVTFLLVPEDEVAWRELLDDKSFEVRGEDGLGQVVQDVFWWLCEEQTTAAGEALPVARPAPPVESTPAEQPQAEPVAAEGD